MSRITPARDGGDMRAPAELFREYAAGLGIDLRWPDTLPSMRRAIAIYRRLGFRLIPAYRNDIVPGILYFVKKLDR